MHLLYSKVIANLLKPLCQNGYKTDDTQPFLSMLKGQLPLILDVEYVLYDLKSLFANIRVDETISYIIDKICQKNKLL